MARLGLEGPAMSGDPYDPTWVVELARLQYPEDRRLHEALSACTRVVRYCDCGCGTPYFVRLDPDALGEDSEFGLRVTLKREAGPDVVVDILPDGRVMSIEGFRLQ